MVNEKNITVEEELIVPDHPYQCIKCEINFHNKGYRFIINPRHRCWYDDEEVVEQLQFCPECGTQLSEDLETGDDYCSHCGLITRSSSEYVAGSKFDLPYGLKI